jgi:D-tagatose-1,6-bisphosphate aldolase subunit GatZ/KbaZ
VEAAARQALADGGPVLVEATCNQVNHMGGYTGRRPAEFRCDVMAVAAEAGLPGERVLLGGDHLGPSPWRDLPAPQAMRSAAETVAAYVAAGYQKIHIDTSMGCLGEPEQLEDDLVAARAAQLVAVAEEQATLAGTSPSYVVGTEVPTPGGAHQQIRALAPTAPASVAATLEAHRAAFTRQGVPAAFERVIAVVVQPGVEFDMGKVVLYDRAPASALPGMLAGADGLAFEAHSTDYQPAYALRQLVEDGFAVLKVGPGLTFAMREALYGLDHAAIAMGRPPERSLARAMEEEMTARPGHWSAYYTGSEDERRMWRHFSYSDRIRYYWPAPGPRRAVRELFEFFADAPVPEVLVSQYLPSLVSRVRQGELAPLARPLVVAAVRDVLANYAAAVRA